LLRPGAVLRTAVPETAVDHDCNALPREGDIGAPAEAGEWVIDAESKPTPMEPGPDSDLWSRIPLALALHPTQSLG
jgi:hypothetical protein